MISQREVERRYNKMLKKNTGTFDTQRYNNYECSSCKYTVKSVDMAKGTTPMFMDCPKCGEKSRSTFYHDKLPGSLPDFGWFRPTLKETYKFRKKPEMLKHILDGGLIPKHIEPKMLRPKESDIHIDFKVI